MAKEEINSSNNRTYVLDNQETSAYNLYQKNRQLTCLYDKIVFLFCQEIWGSVCCPMLCSAMGSRLKSRKGECCGALLYLHRSEILLCLSRMRGTEAGSVYDESGGSGPNAVQVYDLPGDHSGHEKAGSQKQVQDP